ncbi:MAG: hypothetical protein KJ574_03170 [Nanoarchaeota archaeon]|nr:hypothetical protein [Nanoarchaeota archaeon]
MKTTSASIFALIVALLLILSGCGPTDNQPVLNVNFRTGTEGLKMSFIENMPTDKLFAGEQFNIGLYLENAGAHDIDRGIITISGYERNQYTFAGGNMTGETALGPNSMMFQLRGRSQYDSQGEKTPMIFDVKSNCYPAMAQQIRTNLTTTFRATACYTYATIANAQVCIDTNPLSTQSTQKKTCQVKSIPLSGGQGGPVGVTMIEPSMIPVGDGVRARFIIHVKNLNTNGIVYATSAFDNNCENIPGMKLQNKVLFGASLANIPMYCNPGPEVELRSAQDTLISCEADLTREGGVYETQLIMSLEYAYSQDTIKKVNVNKPLNVAIPDCMG